MLDIQQITDTINELEQGDTTFDNCIKLSSLYIVRDNFKSDETTNELDDILPQYRKYCEVKREYQLGNTSKDNVIVAMDRVCKEITEFINSLYSHTDMQEERDLLSSYLKSV